MWLTEAIFTKITSTGQLFVRNSSTKFYENPVQVLISNTRSRKDGKVR